jgi:hypothetical protein
MHLGMGEFKLPQNLSRALNNKIHYFLCDLATLYESDNKQSQIQTTDGGPDHEADRWL